MELPGPENLRKSLLRSLPVWKDFPPEFDEAVNRSATLFLLHLQPGLPGRDFDGDIVLSRMLPLRELAGLVHSWEGGDVQMG